MDCCLGDQVRAISAASCTDEYNTPSDYKTYQNTCVARTRTPAIRFTHDSSGADSEYPAPLFATTASLYEHWNGCAATTTTLSSHCSTYNNCKEPLQECKWDGIGHHIPPNWGADTWGFFNGFKSE